MKTLLAPHFEPYLGQKEEHELLTSAFAKVGLHYQPWDASEGEIPEADAIFWQGISSYHQRMNRFEALLKQTEKNPILSLNTPSLLRWNADKRYLQELEEKGILTLDTLWLDCYDAEIITSWITQKAYEEVVVKPVISAGAHLTYRLTKAEVETQQYPSNIPLMAQQFASEILTGGEISFLFFGGEFSHAVCKTPKTGDYRIQHVHGGKYERINPLSEQLEQARKVLEVLPEQPFYARVDGIFRQQYFLLMEIELIEPYFYLDAAPEKVDLLAQKISQKLEQNEYAQ
jgi:glutathione synthase/RimK-type ligase-like ATP-grasp enzyme